jgi:putative DNA primase/helicase
VKLVLYRLPDLLVADPSLPRFIAEGEKDCDNLARLGLVATCNPMGGGKWHVVTSHDPLRDHHVVVLPDNDDTGRNHAQQVARSLWGEAASIKVLELPGLPDKGDVTDWLAQGHTREELLALAESAPEWEPIPESSEGWLPLGELPQIPSPPSLPPELIPAPLLTWTVDIAERACIPLEYVACSGWAIRRGGQRRGYPAGQV